MALVQGMRSLWPFWSFWSPAALRDRYYDHQATLVKTRLPLAYQILVFQVAIILLSALIGAAAAVWQASQELDSQSEQRSLAIAESVANNASIQEALLSGDPDAVIQRAAETVRHSTGALYVVVTDAKGIRYSHPNPRLIGKPVDENPASVLAGQPWVGVQRGTLGISARGKAPIFYQGRVIGMVSVGFLEPPLAQRLLGELPGFATTLLPSLAIGVIASWLLASRLKRQTFGLEPYEIAGLLEEREASLQGIHEGAIATDRDGTITLANEQARRLLSLPGDCVGRKVAQVLPQGRLLKFLSGGLKDEDEVLLAGERVLVASRRAILVRGHAIGHVATLRDTTELTGLARGLGVDSLTDALRAQAHEFANRLHTIAGLMQVGRGEEAMKLIAQTSGLHQELTESLLERVGDPVLGALLLAKAAIASERGIELRVSDDTVMTRSPAGRAQGAPSLDSEDLITVLGNLIDNALDAAATSGERWVSVSVTEQDGELVIKVHDSGGGVPEGVDGQIFQEGFSTKTGSNRKRRGFGLALVRQVARRNGGEVSVVNDGGALFTVRLPLKVAAGR
jgi:two-component system CitB family sensor kinase